MTNMIQNAKDQAAALAMAAYKAAAADGTLPEAEVKTAPVEIPKDTANGDIPPPLLWLPPRHWANRPA